LIDRKRDKMLDKLPQPSEQDSDPLFGPWLRRRRRALDLTQDDLAQHVGCVADTVRKLEAGMRRPSRAMAERLAHCLLIPVEAQAAFLTAARAGHAPPDRTLPPIATLSITNMPTIAPRTSHLPAPISSFIGREWEVDTVGARLRTPDVRLVTLTGAGGIGKTRLALQIASTLHDIAPQGVWFVDLAPISDPALVISTIAHTLGVREQPGLPIAETLRAALHQQQLLLLLDNFEQVVAAAPELAQLLAGLAGMKVLVTSREALRLSGEHVVVVAPLAVPPTDDRRRTTDDQARSVVVGGQGSVVRHYAAAQLFVARAQAAADQFQLTDANAPAVAAICARLDGLPLAIELAAAQVSLFSPQALLTRLEQRLPLLTHGPRDLPARQQTIRNTIEWSYNLLDAGEQPLFARLAVFVGGCTLAAAEGVCNADHDLPVEVLDGLAALVDKSLLRQAEGRDGEPRFAMLETIREYALEQLEASGETERLRQQHAGYYLILGEAKRSEELPQSPAQLAHLDSDYDNLWSALAWSQTSAGDPEVALRLTRALRAFWLNRGIRREAITALERSLNHPLGVGRTVGHAAARFDLAQFLRITGNYAAARIQYEQVLLLAREVGDTYRHTAALQRLGWLAREQGDSATAWARLTESLAIFRELGYTASIAEALNTLAEVAILDEDPARAEALLAESRAIEQLEQAGPNGWALNHLGHAAQLRGAYDRAAQLHHQSLACFQAFGEQHTGLPWAYQSLGEAALGLGRLDEATRWLAQGLALSQTIGDQASMAWCLAGLGSAAALEAQPARAARLWGAAERLQQAIGGRPAPAARATYERALAMARAQLDDTIFAAAWAAGRTLTLEQAIAEALAPS
jgi:predicted ATPase/transcriptional regulator with XRE-family HTH domain